MIATVIVDVWTLHCDSVAGILCTLCTQLSNFIMEYTLLPLIFTVTNLIHQISESCSSSISAFRHFVVAYHKYILSNSAAKSHASSPPAAGLISKKIFFSSLGSLGRSSILIFLSKSSSIISDSLSCSFAISIISVSFSVSISS